MTLDCTLSFLQLDLALIPQNKLIIISTATLLHGNYYLVIVFVHLDIQYSVQYTLFCQQFVEKNLTVHKTIKSDFIIIIIICFSSKTYPNMRAYKSDLIEKLISKTTQILLMGTFLLFNKSETKVYREVKIHLIERTV